jgi:DNA-binding transcriptional LysR family regulator
MMEFRRGHLLYFITVAEEGQMTRAARKLHLAQPALSQAIAQLESDLGITLLDRHHRGVSLTPAGETFLVKARAVVSAWADAVATTQSLAEVGPGTIEFGFVGSPPGLDSPGPLEAFARLHPQIDIRYLELPFPTSPTASWLADVDVAVCHAPPKDPDAWSQVLRRDPRVLLAPNRHHLARRSELAVADVLDETFIGFHKSVEPAWAGFWSLDDHRGEPPEHATPDRAANAQEVLAALVMRDALTTVPASVARVILNALVGLVAIPLRDAEYATIVLTGREDRRTARVEALRAFASGRPRPGSNPEARGARGTKR